jgi:Fungal specific transcription factor domain
MSVREAGCGREAKGWVYSGMSFRMACDLGLNLDSGGMYYKTNSALDETEEDARRITFWGCFLFDKYVSATGFVGHISTLPGFLINIEVGC